MPPPLCNSCPIVSGGSIVCRGANGVPSGRKLPPAPPPEDGPRSILSACVPPPPKSEPICMGCPDGERYIGGGGGPGTPGLGMFGAAVGPGEPGRMGMGPPVGKTGPGAPGLIGPAGGRPGIIGEKFGCRLFRNTMFVPFVWTFFWRLRSRFRR